MSYLHKSYDSGKLTGDRYLNCSGVLVEQGLSTFWLVVRHRLAH
ncbi:hypothetical protein [Nostoc sp. CHAB 5715]|nr:hypothetical protein [Nostoc sp. CHAB 5715]